MFEQLLARLGRGLDAAGLPYMLIGGQAVLLHGEPRATVDIDVTVGVDAAELARLLGMVRELKMEVLPNPPEPFVAQTNVLPVRDPQTGIRVDFIFSFTPYEEQAIARAVRQPVGGYPLRFAAAEDLILHKLFAGRPRDIEDIRGVLARQRNTLDRQYLRRWAGEFSVLEGKRHLSKQLDGLLEEVQPSE
jgi:hypothetical protein